MVVMLTFCVSTVQAYSLSSFHDDDDDIVCHHFMMTMMTFCVLTVQANWELAGYNPPWTLPFLRTNELHVPVDAGPGVSA